MPGRTTHARRLLATAAGVVAAFAVVGCGGSSGDGGIPSDLAGSYSTTLQQGDLPVSPPPELADGGLDWTLTIASSGGPGDGPVLVLDSAKVGNLEAPALAVDGDRLLLQAQECFENGSYVFYDNEYRWALDGSTLTITEVENQCADEVASTILTSRPWTKIG